MAEGKDPMRGVCDHGTADIKIKLEMKQENVQAQSGGGNVPCPSNLLHDVGGDSAQIVEHPQTSSSLTQNPSNTLSVEFPPSSFASGSTSGMGNIPRDKDWSIPPVRAVFRYTLTAACRVGVTKLPKSYTPNVRLEISQGRRTASLYHMEEGIALTTIVEEDSKIRWLLKSKGVQPILLIKVDTAVFLQFENLVERDAACHNFKIFTFTTCLILCQNGQKYL